MAYLHCHTKGCGWEQDDFWEIDGYNPFREDLVKYDKEALFKEEMYIDKEFFEEAQDLPYKKDEKGYYCKGTDFVAWSLERKARNIRNMIVKTYDEWQEKKIALVCPRCGQQNWDID